MFLYRKFLFILTGLFFLSHCYFQQFWNGDSDSSGNDNEINPESEYRNSYYTHSQINEKLVSFINSYPTICRQEVIGYSEENREIKALKISDNVNLDETEPAVRLLADIHGDEKLSGEILLRLIEYVLLNYSVNSKITNIVNNLEIYCVVTVNPDGLENIKNGTRSSIRYNANYVDLNRNFASSWQPGTYHGTSAFSEAESLAIKALHEKEYFSSGLDLHTGSFCLTYLLDSVARDKIIEEFGYNYYLTYYLPDDEYIVELADNFIKLVNLKNFKKTNGGDWYIINGSIPEWSYESFGCIVYTVEMNHEKQSEFNFNKEKYKYGNIYTYESLDELIDERFYLFKTALIDYLDKSRYGLSGIISDAGSNLPIGARIQIQGYKYEILSSVNNGFFHRMLKSGEYNLTVKAEGYQEKRIHNILIKENETAFISIMLNK